MCEPYRSKFFIMPLPLKKPKKEYKLLESALRSAFDPQLFEVSTDFLFAKSIKRKFEADFYIHFPYNGSKLAIEVEGGIYSFSRGDGKGKRAGAHGTPAGILRDMEKANIYAALGIKLLRVTPAQADEKPDIIASLAHSILCENPNMTMLKALSNTKRPIKQTTKKLKF